MAGTAHWPLPPVWAPATVVLRPSPVWHAPQHFLRLMDILLGMVCSNHPQLGSQQRSTQDILNVGTPNGNFAVASATEIHSSKLMTVSALTWSQVTGCKALLKATTDTFILHGLHCMFCR